MFLVTSIEPARDFASASCRREKAPTVTSLAITGDEKVTLATPRLLSSDARASRFFGQENAACRPTHFGKYISSLQATEGNSDEQLNQVPYRIVVPTTTLFIGMMIRTF
jgi:hypothetical protein